MRSYRHNVSCQCCDSVGATVRTVSYRTTRERDTRILNSSRHAAIAMLAHRLSVVHVCSTCHSAALVAQNDLFDVHMSRIARARLLLRTSCTNGTYITNN